jgi:hypothetical protein
MNLIRQLTPALILSVGFTVLCLLIGNWTGEQVRHALRRNDPYQRLGLKGDGTPVVIIDRPVLDPNEGPELPAPDEVWLDTAFLSADEHQFYASLFDDWHWRLRQFTDKRFPGIVWYFVCDAQTHGTAYFAGYESKTNECIGYLGTAGFRTESLPAGERFPFRGSERGSNRRLHALNAIPFGQYAPIGTPAPRDLEMPWHVFVQADNNTIYKVDLAQRAVNVALQEPGIRSSAILLQSHPPADAGRRDLVVRTDDNIVVMNGTTNERQQFVIPAELRETSFSWGQTTTGDLLAVWSSQLTPESESVSYYVALFDAAGAISRRSDTAVSNPSLPNDLRLFLGLNAPAPLLVDSCVGLWLPLRSWPGPRESYGAALPRYLVEYWPSLVFVHALSATLAWLCYRRQKMNGASRSEQVVWSIFVFLLGLPGWIGYRYTIAWRVAESPAPELRGTEVFA